MTVLVIEDDSSVLSMVERLLTAKGHTVLAAHDPNDAAGVLAKHGNPPDLAPGRHPFWVDKQASITHVP